MEPISDDDPFVLEIEEMLSALPEAINQDFARSFEFYGGKKSDPYARRQLVRAVMTFIDGHMGAIRQQLICQYHFITDDDMAERVPAAATVAKKMFGQFLAKDYFALIGKSYKDMKRKKLIRDENLCADETIKLIFKLHGKVYGHSISPVEEADGWQALAETKKKRNQLTHPACSADLEVSESQARQAMVVFIWLRSYLDRIREIETRKWKELYDELLNSKET